MAISDFPMNKQFVFGHIWKRLKIIVVDFNQYELILIYIGSEIVKCPHNMDFVQFTTKCQKKIKAIGNNVG